MLVDIYDTTTTWTSVKITKMLSQDILDEERLTSIWNETMIPIFDPRRKVFIDRESSMSFLNTLQNNVNPLQTGVSGLTRLILPFAHQVYLIRSTEEFLVLLSSDPWSALCYKWNKVAHEGADNQWYQDH